MLLREGVIRVVPRAPKFGSRFRNRCPALDESDDGFSPFVYGLFSRCQARIVSRHCVRVRGTEPAHERRVRDIDIASEGLDRLAALDQGGGGGKRVGGKPF